MASSVVLLEDGVIWQIFSGPLQVIVFQKTDIALGGLRTRDIDQGTKVMGRETSWNILKNVPNFYETCLPHIITPPPPNFFFPLTYFALYRSTVPFGRRIYCFPPGLCSKKRDSSENTTRAQSSKVQFLCCTHHCSRDIRFSSLMNWTLAARRIRCAVDREIVSSSKLFACAWAEYAACTSFPL